MSIRWLTISLLLADFILIGSDGLPVSSTDTEDKQWIGTDSKDVNRLNGRSDSLPKFDNSGVPIEAQKMSTLLSHQETKCHRHEEDKRLSPGKTNYLIAALSKIAKIRSFEDDSPSTRRDLMTNVYNAARESTYVRNGVSAKDTGASALLDTKLSPKLSSNGISDNLSSDGIGRENFHCRATQDVYIPETKENIPSYACTTGSKTFTLSSERFFQDRRSSLRVNIDDDTLRKLNDPAITLSSSRFNVIPAILILKPGHESYDIRNRQSVILREQQSVRDKNIE